MLVRHSWDVVFEILGVWEQSFYSLQHFLLLLVMVVVMVSFLLLEVPTEESLGFTALLVLGVPLMFSRAILLHVQVTAWVAALVSCYFFFSFLLFLLMLLFFLLMRQFS